MKIKYLFIILFIITSKISFAQVRPIIEVDTPTAFTIGTGAYNLSLLAYDDGGVELKAIIGLHENIYLGASFDVQNLIGRKKPVPNIPGVVARFKLTDGPAKFPFSVALGYDSFYIGKQGRQENDENILNRVTYGPYLAITKPLYILDYEQYISFGFRIPTQPYFDELDTSYFFSIDVPLGSSFNIKAEMERVFWDFRNPEEWMFNFGFRYTYLEQLSLEFDLLVQPNQRVPNRIIKIEYLGEF